MYDENSFLAGISVGRRLPGLIVQGGGGGNCPDLPEVRWSYVKNEIIGGIYGGDVGILLDMPLGLPYVVITTFESVYVVTVSRDPLSHFDARTTDGTKFAPLGSTDIIMGSGDYPYTISAIEAPLSEELNRAIAFPCADFTWYNSDYELPREAVLYLGAWFILKSQPDPEVFNQLPF